MTNANCAASDEQASIFFYICKVDQQVRIKFLVSGVFKMSSVIYSVQNHVSVSAVLRTSK